MKCSAGRKVTIVHNFANFFGCDLVNEIFYLISSEFQVFKKWKEVGKNFNFGLIIDLSLIYDHLDKRNPDNGQRMESQGFHLLPIFRHDDATHGKYCQKDEQVSKPGIS